MQRLGLLAAVAVLGAAGSAHAQNITVTVRALGTRSGTEYQLDRLDDVDQNPIVSAECNQTITLRFNGVDINRTQIQFYQGTNCDDPTVRNDNNSATCDPLSTAPTLAISNRSEVEGAIPINTLVPCTGTSAGTVPVWALAVDNNTSTVSGVGQKVQFTLAYDFAGPGAVAGLSVRAGDASITLGWNNDASNEEYQIFFDPAGCDANGMPTGSITPDNPGTPFRTVAAATGTAIEWPAGTAYGSYAAVAVRAVDNGGNVGTLSQVQCVQRVQVSTWWNSYCGDGADGGSRPTACDRSSPGCRAAPGRSPTAWWLAILAAAACALALRRRS